MDIKIYCSGHFRQFTATPHSYQEIFFCGGCSKKVFKNLKKRMEQTFMKLAKIKNSTSDEMINVASDLGMNLNSARVSDFSSSLPSDSTFSSTLSSFYSLSSLSFFGSLPSLPSLSSLSSAFLSSGQLMTALCLSAVVIFNIDSLQAVPLDSLRAPMTALKTEVWSYMYVVKVAAALMGGLMSVVQQNLMPLGIGGGIAAGIHFFDGVIGDGSAALIGF